MKKFYLPIILTTALIATSIMYTSCQFSTANIQDATMSLDVDPETKAPIERTDKYRMWMPTFHGAVKVANAPSDTKVKAVWFVDRADEEQVMDSTELAIESDGWVDFSLTRSKSRWPYGEYRVDIYLNDKFDRSIPFQVVPTYTDAPISEIMITAGVTERQEPMPPMSVFPSSADPIYAFIFAYEPEGPTTYRAVWYQASPEGLYILNEAEVVHDATGWLTFSLTPNAPLPPGTYLLEVLIDGESFDKLEFNVE
jgi:hypothetical protein